MMISLPIFCIIEPEIQKPKIPKSKQFFILVMKSFFSSELFSSWMLKSIQKEKSHLKILHVPKFLTGKLQKKKSECNSGLAGRFLDKLIPFFTVIKFKIRRKEWNHFQDTLRVRQIFQMFVGRLNYRIQLGLKPSY